MTRKSGPRWLLAVALALALCSLESARAQEMVFQVDPAQSRIDFTLGDVLHTVHGTFRLKECAIRFDPQSGAASGTFVADATSGESGSSGRDKKMHKEILESVKFPEIRFTLQKFRGTLPAEGTAQVQLVGVMTLHGGDHPMIVTAPVQVTNGRVSADVHFEVPYVSWGLKNPSTFLLRVSDKVEIVVHAAGTVSAVVPAARPEKPSY